MLGIFVSRAATCTAAPQKINGYFVDPVGEDGYWDVDELEPGTPAGYITPDIPEFEAPRYLGQRYGARVPDTLDLAERARLAIHFLTESPLPWCDYDICAVNLIPYPRMLSSSYSSADTTVKLKEAVCMARLMSGSDQNLHVDRRWMAVILKQQGPDGLIYMPVKGRPWVLAGLPNNVSGGVPDVDQWLSPFVNGQTLRNMAMYSALADKEFWQERLRKVVDGLVQIAVDRGDYAFFWPGAHSAETEPPPDVKPRFHFSAVELSQTSFGLTRGYRATGYQPALELARKLNTYQRECFYTPDGQMITPQKDAVRAHTLAHVRSMISMADYGLIAGDREMLEFVRKTYEWAKSHANTETGYFPNLLPCPPWRMPERIEGEMGNWPPQVAGTHFSLRSPGDLNPCETASSIHADVGRCAQHQDASWQVSLPARTAARNASTFVAGTRIRTPLGNSISASGDDDTFTGTKRLDSHVASDSFRVRKRPFDRGRPPSSRLRQ